jgi:hypothetical protein
MTIATSCPVPQFFDLDGSPLDSGSIYYGKNNLNPETDPVTVYWDLACTQPVSQPVKTVNGYASRNGTPANVYANSDYSMTVKNRKGALIIYIPQGTQFGNAGQIGAVVSNGQTVTLNVPSQYADVQAAFDAIQSWVISGTVVIQVADGTYDWTRTQRMNHPFGKNIKVQGNISTPNNCVIRGTNPPTFDMFLVDNGNTLGYLDGFLVSLTAKATLANNWTAVLANNGGSIICGNSMKTNNWYYGIAARNGSFVKCQYANVNNAGDVGIWSMNGSAVDAQYATSTNASDTTNSWGFGFQAEYGSFIDCSNGNASGCNIAGIAALSNSTVRALTATSSSNVGSGIYAAVDGTVECHNAIANNNTRFGTERSLGGVIVGGNLTTTGNVLGAYAGYAYWDNSGSLGARIAADGPLRIDNNATDPVYFNTSGGLQFVIQHTPDATSQLYVQGGGPSTADQPIIGARGTAANISMRTQAKGNGAHYFNNGNGVEFEVAGGGSNPVVNHVYVKGGEAGKPVTVGASGDDAIIDLQLFPKGTGSYVQLGAGSFPVTTETVQGFLTVKDADGVLCKLAVLV